MSSSSNSQSISEIFRYLELVWRKRYLFFLTAILVTVLVAGFVYTLPKKYQADSTVFIEKGVINRLVKGLAVTPDMEHRIRVLKYAMTSREMITRVLQELDSPIFTKSKAERQKYIADLRKRVKVSIRGRKDLFTISLVDKDPKFAQEFVNTLVSKYVEENISAKRVETYGANRFLKEQIAKFKKKLEDAENAIIAYRKEKGIYFSRNENVILSEIKHYREQVENINLSLATQDAKIKRLRWQLKRIKPTVDIFSGTGGANSLAVLKQKLAMLLTKYTENYPEVIRVKAQIEELEKKQKAEKGSGATKSSSLTTVNPLYQKVQQQLYDAEVEASSLRAEKASLEKRIAEREAALREVPEARKKLGALTQKRDSIRDIYQKLLGRLAQSEVSKQIEISDKAATFKIIDPALYPEKPVSPNMPVMLAAALAGGLGVAFGLIYLLDLLDDSLKNPHQLEAMGINPLVVIPTIEEGGLVDTRIRKRDVLFFAGVGLFYCSYLVLLVAEIMQLDPFARVVARLASMR